MEKYVISHDVGTSSVKTAIVSNTGEILAATSSSYSYIIPQPGWLEQNPMDYWNGIVKNTKIVIEKAGIDKSQIIGIVFGTQALGIIPIDKDDNILHNNITWVDGRAEEEALWIMKRLGGKKMFKAIAGVKITGKDVIPKLRWIKMHRPDIYNSAEYFLDVNGFLKFKATGRKVFEWGGACAYGFDLKKKDWERVIFKMAGIDVNKFAPLVKSTDIIGQLTPEAAAELDLPETINVFGGTDDIQSAALGAGANNEHDVHVYLGTSAWVGVTTAKNIKHKNGVVCLQSGDPKHNVLLGESESACSNIDWIINNFYQKEKDDPAIQNIFDFLDEETAGIPDGCDYLLFTPWFMGERCPVSSTTTRGTIFNMSLEHKRGHVVKAMLEGIGYNLRWSIENMERDFKLKITEFTAIGGGSTNRGWMQCIANITGKKVTVITQPTMAGAIGVACCAFVGSGVFNSFDEVNKLIEVKEVFYPRTENKAMYDKMFSTYKEIYYSLNKTYKKINFKRFNH